MKTKNQEAGTWKSKKQCGGQCGKLKINTKQYKKVEEGKVKKTLPTINKNQKGQYYKTKFLDPRVN